jgi:prepilin-type N-terminal cleavage/methylation domain-containing protein
MTGRGDRKGGFTVVEITIVVSIIGMVAAVGLPSFIKARSESRISRMINDLRTVYDAFNMYAMEHGNCPEFGDGVGGLAYLNNTPQPVAEYLTGTKWKEPSSLGGTWIYYDWQAGSVHGILVDDFNFNPGRAPMASSADFQKIDDQIDDGNLFTGRFQYRGQQMLYSVDDEDWIFTS